MIFEQPGHLARALIILPVDPYELICKLTQSLGLVRTTKEDNSTYCSPYRPELWICVAPPDARQYLEEFISIVK